MHKCVQNNCKTCVKISPFYTAIFFNYFPVFKYINFSNCFRHILHSPSPNKHPSFYLLTDPFTQYPHSLLLKLLIN